MRGERETGEGERMGRREGRRETETERERERERETERDGEVGYFDPLFVVRTDSPREKNTDISAIR